MLNYGRPGGGGNEPLHWTVAQLVSGRYSECDWTSDIYVQRSIPVCVDTQQHVVTQNKNEHKAVKSSVCNTFQFESQPHLGMINRCPAHKTCQQSVNTFRFNSFPIKIPKSSSREHRLLNLTCDGGFPTSCAQENFTDFGGFLVHPHSKHLTLRFVVCYLCKI